ncbi:1-deoxy-D-xylulose 5-phosphate reductoisomerase [Roseibium aquae]|uniref:1-deoxy-D-xylulose 5-phosphate reductoisomerase n=1 Tax=Roseibium aquae TaxID=1323746 RepID=A0A916X3A4_9HYPH|nr:1-deoxy-D-xylulose-5-phosphate reductoisomerase [Roseibium aquae]GGB60363.1 1-deoxy-D-xylulose 5-phosphate reductoisomerase [Roseibium aquae]
MDIRTHEQAGPKGSDQELAGGEPVRVILLGSTGSVGKSAIDVILQAPGRYKVVALVANSNATLLAEQAKAVRADCAVLADPAQQPVLEQMLAGSGIETGTGRGAVLEAVDRPAGIVIGAIVGSAGLEPTLAALKPGRTLALANKECLVSAGDLFMEKVRATGARVLPVDSEHNAIFQVFERHNADRIDKIILTASGGPFRTLSLEEMARVTPQAALKHPNFSMGNRITIDSATMMNKGFEVIEAFHLFPVERHQLDILVHPQQIVHGLVQYTDGSLLAQMGAPDMRTPIAHCLAYPGRMETTVERLDLAKAGSLTFEAPDLMRFPALALALSALDRGNGATAALNAADEVAVGAFLAGRIGYLQIADAISHAIETADKAGLLVPQAALGHVLEIDKLARISAEQWIERAGVPI